MVTRPKRRPRRDQEKSEKPNKMRIYIKRVGPNVYAVSDLRSERRPEVAL